MRLAIAAAHVAGMQMTFLYFMQSRNGRTAFLRKICGQAFCTDMKRVQYFGIA